MEVADIVGVRFRNTLQFLPGSGVPERDLPILLQGLSISLSHRIVSDLLSLLSGHQRSLTQIKYNKEGDLLFTCSKDSVINVWYSHNGERLGTYDGHNGSVWTVDVDCEHSSPIYRIYNCSPRHLSFQPSPNT